MSIIVKTWEFGTADYAVHAATVLSTHAREAAAKPAWRCGGTETWLVALQQVSLLSGCSVFRSGKSWIFVQGTDGESVGTMERKSLGIPQIPSASQL
jgi:hypothetical protein